MLAPTVTLSRFTPGGRMAGGYTHIRVYFQFSLYTAVQVLQFRGFYEGYQKSITQTRVMLFISME